MKRLPVVRTGDVALDRFLDGVRQYIESGEVSGSNRVLRVADIPAIAAQSQASLDAAAFEVIAKGVMESKLFQTLTAKLATPFATGDTKMTLVRQTATESVVRANNDSATAELVTTVASRVDDTETGLALVETSASTSASKITGLEAQYTVKVMAGGAVAGYGLSITANNAAPSSAFVVAADRFAVVKPDGTGTAKVPFSIDTGTGKVAFTADVVIDGGLVVSGTITSDKVGTNTLSAVSINTTGQIRSSGSYSATSVSGYKAAVVGENSATGSGESGLFGYGRDGVVGFTLYNNGTGAALKGITQSPSGTGLSFMGCMQWNNLVGGVYTWSAPSGSGTTYLRDDGTWGTPSGGGSFTPVQQGGGTNQLTNKLYVGWSAASKLRVQVDSSDFGATWPIDISGNANYAATAGSTSYATSSGSTSYATSAGSASSASTLSGYGPSSWFRFISTTSAPKTFVGYVNVDVNGTSNYWIPVYA